jgi:hypothetical protein
LTAIFPSEILDCDASFVALTDDMMTWMLLLLLLAAVVVVVAVAAAAVVVVVVAVTVGSIPTPTAFYFT